MWILIILRLTKKKRLLRKNLNNWTAYILIGKLFIYLFQQFPLQNITKNKTLLYLHNCDLCSGVWIYSVLAFVFQISFLEIWGLENLPFIDETLLGGITSFIMHIFSLGWKAKFETVV